jgi:hypothetical protein
MYGITAKCMCKWDSMLVFNGQSRERVRVTTVCENVACRNGCRSETVVAENICNGQKVTDEN